MKTPKRATSTGQSLISQGEPMVWLTGGMFAIACCMIFALLGLILYKGLATHWQRPFAIYPLLNGELEAGELQYQQNFNLTQQSLSQFDEASRAKAENLLKGAEQVDSIQLYLRTGNYDVTNRHFAFLPEVTLNIDATAFRSNRVYMPEEVWLLERREWGVMYGFPTRLEQSFSPELIESYSRLKLLLDNAETLAPDMGAGESKTDSSPDNPVSNNSGSKLDFAALLAESLAEAGNRERSEWEKSLPGGKATSEAAHVVADPASIRAAVDVSHRRQSKLIAAMERAKQKLGRLDRQLSNSRVAVRKAEIYDHVDLQSLADDSTQMAMAKGTSVAIWLELSNSIEAWKARFFGNKSALDRLEKVRSIASARFDEEIKTIDESMSGLMERLQTLPMTSQRSIQEAIKTADAVARTQYGLNAEIARLEAAMHSEVLTLQVPSLDWLGDAPMIEPSAVSDGDYPKREVSFPMSPELAKSMGLDEGMGDLPKSVQRTELSSKQSLLTIDLPQGRRRFWMVEYGEKKIAKIAALREKGVLVADMVRFVQPNQLGWIGKCLLYVERWFEFLFGQPREGGIEGGFFPALWGTIVMTLIMSIAVMPFGVIAALYMREYARSGWVLSIIRISINNLAGVPSIVYGVFGLSFFCYTIGGYIDGGPEKAGFTPWPSSVWFVALAITAMLGTIAFFLAALASGSPAQMSPFRKSLASFGGLFWLLSLVGIVCLMVKSPFFHGFYEATLPNPTFGKGCLLWASCTLALLTLPVVIVATEEALSAVPNSIREGSYACGAGKWQTLQRIVLPYARPGIITGFILAMARGAGEVAPMMLVGAIPLVTELPLDLDFPFFHGSRSFMHLGFQIYSLGFQSQNSEAAKPMVFTATLLLLTIVTLLNVTAIWLRARLRKRFQGSQF